MKLSILLSAAAAAVTSTAFVVPNEQILAQVVEEEGQISSLLPNDLVVNNIEAWCAWCSDEEEDAETGNIDDLDGSDSERLLSRIPNWFHGQSMIGSFPDHGFDEPTALQLQGHGDFSLDEDPDIPKPFPYGHGHGLRKPTKTIYQLISESKHTKIYAHILSQFQDIVDALNSTVADAHFTVFVPIDAAFRKFKDHPPKVSEEFRRKWIQYHISPAIYSRTGLFSVQTIPSVLEQGNAAAHPQRIRTQWSLHGLKLNFFTKVIKTNIPATNGVIHALDGFLIPPLPASYTIDIVPSLLSTFNLGLLKTGVQEALGPESLVSGATIFAPTNGAFKKLGPRVNAFLFSRWGTKYLKALLEYHIVANHTLYSDAYYEPKTVTDTSGFKMYHVDLPSLLDGRNISIDIVRFYGFARIFVNFIAKVVVPNIPVKEGVIHLVPNVLIPPKKPGSSSCDKEAEDIHSSESETESGMSLEELIARLEPYVK
ncbi:hypothetical protein Egran_00746 [Elaphomyces granulatus]|uniref:FAS1 domain-containing protein n=1 Tax=Elaphomyces granulatus TaxID=519963 RepID=A0A232M5X5_9EURO|nr:hypothetical protein Egran_00746 [Elaphomyces granulatus]